MLGITWLAREPDATIRRVYRTGRKGKSLDVWQVRKRQIQTPEVGLTIMERFITISATEDSPWHATQNLSASWEGSISP